MNWMVCKLGAVPFNGGINRNTVKRLVFHILAKIISWSIKTGNSIASESGLTKRKCVTVIVHTDSYRGLQKKSCNISNF